MPNENEMIAAWQRAAADLGIEVNSPYVVNGEPFPVHLPWFGSAAGALPVLLGDHRSRRKAEAKGYFISLLNPVVYDTYDRVRFIETLVDWGWCGSPGDAPGWYADEVAKYRSLR